MKRLTFILLLVLLSFAGCKKVSPENEIGDPVFSFNGEINGREVSFTAGDDGYYMFTDSQKDSLDITTFEGALRNVSCQNQDACPSSLMWQFRDVRPSETESFIDEAIEPGNYKYRGLPDSVVSGWEVSFTPHLIGSGYYDYNWSFGDNSNDDNNSDPVHFYTADNPEWVSVCLTIDDQVSGCSSSLCTDIHLPAECSTSFTYVYNGTNLFLNAHPSGPPPFNNLWDLGLGYKPLIDYVGYTFPPNIPYAKVCLQTTDANNCVSRYCENIILDNSILDCMANFTYQKETVLEPDFSDFKKVTIIWQDKNGNTFRSDRFDQPSWASLTVKSIREYKTDYQGNPTKSIEIEKVNCRLYGNTPNEFVDLKEGSGVIAVAYRQN